MGQFISLLVGSPLAEGIPHFGDYDEDDDDDTDWDEKLSDDFDDTHSEDFLQPDPEKMLSNFSSTVGPFSTRTSVVVIGGGVMGCAVAAWLSILGNEVSILERRVKPSVVRQRVREHLENAFITCREVWPDVLFAPRGDSPEATAANKEGDAGLSTNTQIEAIFGSISTWLGRVHCYNSSHFREVVRSSQVAIEAVQDDLQLKREVFRDLRRSNPSIILTTNSLIHSAVDISRAAGLPDGDIIGVRWLWPVCWIPIVELITPSMTCPSFKAVMMFVHSQGHRAYGGLSVVRWRVLGQDSSALFEISRCCAQRLVRLKLGQTDEPNSCFVPTDICVVCLAESPHIANIGACTHVCLCERCAMEMWRR
ncbi:hypothetical protein FOZ63_028240 [Perkinsus olseni]|uniref:Uncharacterized protein n=1 Tax=Perkinsus olseni TaxID=32597 RepID=A0A7J6R2T6_PEROL|nr:hypothetical protein FOZ62_023686 [Perkinsus olseni]KAF4729208.1 hypothetical protein FOZ63_028240 [Perkinsus olseni]